MYEKKNVTYILNSLDAIEKIYIYTKGIDNADDFYTLNTQMNFNACQVLLLFIGEEIRKIDENLKKEHSTIPWKRISGLRNKIAHEYKNMDPEISFSIITNSLADLKTELITMLPKIAVEKEFLLGLINTQEYEHLRYLLAYYE